jgi:hypothetical protein
MTRTRIGLALATALLGGAGLLGLAACSPATAAADAALSPEGRALAAMGYDQADLRAAPADPAPAPSASGSASGPNTKARKRALARIMLRRNTLHGEATVQTKNGVQTVDVQRGTVTAIDDRSMTVKSTDGFALTWTFGTPLRVVEHRTTVQPSAIIVGTQVGVAGVKSGGTTTARLIVIPVER